MPMFRKKQLSDVYARQLVPGQAEDIAQWCGGRVVEVEDAIDSNQKFVGINVPTLGGAVRASEGDYIIKDNNGAFSKCTRGEFEAEYDEV